MVSWGYSCPIHDIPATPKAEGKRWQVWGQPGYIARPWMKERNSKYARKKRGREEEGRKEKRKGETKKKEKKKEGGRKRMVFL